MKREPDKITNLHYRFTCLAWSERWEDAAEACRKAIKAGNDERLATYYLCYALLKLGKNKDAEETISKWLAANKSFSDCLMVWHFFLEAGKEEKALEVLRTAMKHAPSSFALWSDPDFFNESRAAAFAYEWKDFDLVLKVCQVHKSMRPRLISFEIEVREADTYLAMGEVEEAKQKAMRLYHFTKPGTPEMKRLHEVLAAIEKEERDFIYKPSMKMKDFTVVKELK
jgi:tetratricopeptide (TPR) repeat protein